MRQRTSNRHTQKQHKTAHIKITNASALLDCFVVILFNYACTHTVPNTSDTAACRLTAPLTLTLIRYDNENAFNQPNDWPAWRRMSRYRQTQQRGKKKSALNFCWPGVLNTPCRYTSQCRRYHPECSAARRQGERAAWYHIDPHTEIKPLFGRRKGRGSNDNCG